MSIANVFPKIPVGLSPPFLRQYMIHRKRQFPLPRNLVIVAGIVLLLGVAGCQGRGNASAPQAPATLPPTVAPEMPNNTSTSPATVPAAGATPQSTLAAPAPTVVLTASVASMATPPAPTTRPDPTATPASVASPATANLPVRILIDLSDNQKIDAPVVEMSWKVVQTADGPRTDWVIPKNATGHHINSVALGEPGNLVISGHNNIYGQIFRLISLAWDDDRRAKVDDFTDRSDVLNGRSIQLFDATGKQFNYIVTDFYRLKDTGVPQEQRIANARFMQPTAETQVTLITCWPPSSNTHRLVVIAKPAN
jgi:sortase A